MLLLILGLVLFLGAHGFTMLRSPRAAVISAIGEGGYKAAYTAVSLVGFALIIYGFGIYRATSWINVWTPPIWAKHLALLLTLPVFVLLAASGSGGRIHAAVKHPMLLAVKIWATAHLLANGDLGGMLMFGGFLAWAVAARISLKRRPGVATPAAGRFTGRDAVAVAAGLVLWAAFVFWLHPLLFGVAVWPGR
jgi:uncharacterized membrane protein